MKRVGIKGILQELEKREGVFVFPAGLEYRNYSENTE